MPYVKISDPNVIDLAAWHQVINVINQHSDSISSITNNLGGTSIAQPDWNGGSDFVQEYEAGSQKILYGKEKLVTADMSPTEPNRQILHGSVDFTQYGATGFSASPIITGTIQFGSTNIEQLDKTNHNVIFNIFNVTPNGYKFRVTRAISDPEDNTPPPALTGFFYLNWSAIGPK